MDGCSHPTPCQQYGRCGFHGLLHRSDLRPYQLLTSTIADELKIATQGKGIVYAIAPFCDAAIFAAGHAGNGAFWINPTTGKWSGTTYYGEFPWWASQYNDRQAIDSRISSVTWEPVFPRGMYTFLPDWRDVVFKYKFDDDRNNKFRRFITSPFVNDEVNALAEEAIGKGSVGMDDITDLLALTYYAGNYAHKSVQECAMEIQDTYVRLDRSIANLLDLLDKKVGLQNVLIFVTSTGYTDSESTDSGLYKIPTGEFHLNRCTALLNMFLMATYGEGKYVEAYHDQQIYLNHKLLEQKQLNLTEVQEKFADFLMQFSGVNRGIFRPPASPGFMDSGNIQNTQRLSPQAFRRPRDRRIAGMDYRQRKRQREQGGTSFLYPRTADLHGSLRETGHHSDTCNNRPYCAYTGSFHAHTGSQCLFFGPYYRSSVKDSSQKPCAKHK